ncbi:hypothetical protein BCY86_08585 [Pajaroellobacter abortibovis]|uniref:Uncharacterized protein n=1 Tax=Pajaroellobacter abortibovis TaxID=1882918 RepID=A0A1L6MYZ3_9BACT|nr:hypothetical protein BCY86_08585 [Pajaroellobacter abortibovis]
MVDLDRARYPRARQVSLVREIVQSVSIPMQVGGGVRMEEDEDVEELLSFGVSRMVVERVCVHHPSFVHQWLSGFGVGRIHLGIRLSA